MNNFTLIDLEWASWKNNYFGKYLEKEKRKKCQKKEIIKWEVDKIIFFSTSERETWHSYSGDGVSKRVSVVYDLITNDIKKAFTIEGKNNIYVRFRSFIKPYLFRFLREQFK